MGRLIPKEKESEKKRKERAQERGEGEKERQKDRKKERIFALICSRPNVILTDSGEMAYGWAKCGGGFRSHRGGDISPPTRH